MNANLEQRIDKITSQIPFQNAWNSILEDINNDVMFSGKPLDTLVLLNRIRSSIIIASILIFPLSIFIATQLSPMFLSLNLIWILIFIFPKIQQSSLSQERKKKVEEELPSFVILASVMQNVGIGMYESFQLFRESGLFNAINKEALLLKRNVEYFGLSQMEALEELGRTHKSDLFKNLLLGYTSIWRSGGDLSFYLEGRAEELFTFLKDRYQGYTNNVSTVIEVLVTLLIILPIMIMVASFILPGSSLEQLTLLSTIGLPLFAVVLSFFIGSIQPSSFNMINLNEKILSLLAGIGFAIGLTVYLFTNEAWMAIISGIMIPSIISGIISGRMNSEVNKLEHSLPQFLRDMTEYKKIGYDVILAMINLSKENLYNSIFNKKLNEMGILLDNGNAPVTSVKNVEFRSWFTKISFYLLAYIAEYGGGNPKTLETISKFITTAQHTVKEGKATISSLTMIIFAAPLIMGFTATIILSILGNFNSDSFGLLENAQNTITNSEELGLGSGFLNLVTITPEFLTMIKTLIVTSSLLGAFVITKAIDFTFFTTWRVVAIGIIAIGSVILVENSTMLELDFNSFLENLAFT